MPIYSVDPDKRAKDILDKKLAALARQQDNLAMKIGLATVQGRSTTTEIQYYKQNKLIIDALNEVRNSLVNPEYLSTSW